MLIAIQVLKEEGLLKDTDMKNYLTDNTINNGCNFSIKGYNRYENTK
jgi:hypothetical protein